MTVGLVLRLVTQAGAAVQLQRVRAVRTSKGRPLAAADALFQLDALGWTAVAAVAALTRARPAFGECVSRPGYLEVH